MEPAVGESVGHEADAVEDVVVGVGEAPGAVLAELDFEGCGGGVDDDAAGCGVEVGGVGGGAEPVEDGL